MFPVLILLVAATAIAAALLTWSHQRSQPENVSMSMVETDPPPLGYQMSWLAVRTTDTDGLMSMLGLRGTREVSWAEGVNAVYAERCPNLFAFVTPPIGGWILVAGLALPHPLGSAFQDKCTPLIEGLSAKFGAAHYYFSFPLLDYYAWAKAEDGSVVRAFATGDEGVLWDRGRLSPEERRLNFQYFELRGVEDRHGDVGGDMLLVPTEQQVLKLAGAWSCDPSRLNQAQGLAVQTGYLGRAPTSWRSELRYPSVAA